MTGDPWCPIHGQVLCMCRSAPESLPIVRDERIWFPDMPTMAGVPPLTDFGPHSHEDAAVNPNGPADVEAARKAIDREARRRHDAGLAERIAASLRLDREADLAASALPPRTPGRGVPDEGMRGPRWRRP